MQHTSDKFLLTAKFIYCIKVVIVMIPPLSYGTKNQVRFDSNEEFFRTLGFLASSRHSDIHIEHNEDQGAWSHEGRIHCYGNIQIFPEPLKRAATRGTGNIDFRVNCNEYVEYIMKNHKFIQGRNQDISKIRTTVPEEYEKNFDEGLAI